MSLPNTRLGEKRISALLSERRKIFFCGIGGIHMSSLAHIAQLAGYEVSGSDRCRTPLTDRLCDEGITIYYGNHDASHIGDADVFVYTVAISQDNPEYLEALRRNIPTVSRADFLGWVMSGYTRRVGVSGSHGKSTCVSMLAHIFTATGLDPTVVSGAEYAGMNGAYRIGGRENFIFEACEYMDNFLSFYPSLAVILNVEFDHGDYFADLDAIRASFRKYASLSLDGGGRALCCADDASCLTALRGLPVLTFGIKQKADWQARNISLVNGAPHFDVLCPDGSSFRIDIPLPGEHNVYNALAAFAIAELCGADREKAAAAFSTFLGAKRRMEYKKTVNGARVIEDYAHHPTEIAATIRAAKSAATIYCGTRGRVLVAFQPHTYSRTAELFDGFAAALSDSDCVFLAPIYSARETDTLGVSSEKLAGAIPGARALPDFPSLAEAVMRELQPGDTLLVMGAGDINRLTDMLG